MDVLDSLAEAIETRVLNRDEEKDGAFTMKDRGSRFVQCPYDAKIDRRDGIVNKGMKSTAHVEDGMAMPFAEVVDPDVVCWCKGLRCLATIDGPAASARLTPHSVQVPDPV